MYDFILNYFTLYNKVLSSNIFYYFFIINLFIIIYLFYFTFIFFFKLILNLLFILNVAFLISFFNMDFFSGFLLAAELPIILIFLIFYFHKNAVQIDNIYKFNIKNNNFLITIFIFFFLLFLLFNTNNLFFSFYNLCLNNSFSIYSKNDFLILYIINYNYNFVLPLIFAILIFFVSIFVILLYQLLKHVAFSNNNKKNNILILRKQNLLKQATYKFKFFFFNKKL